MTRREIQPDVVRLGARRFPIGAEIVEGGVSFRVWAPHRQSVRLRLELPEGSVEETLEAQHGGYHALRSQRAYAGCRYWFLLDDDPKPYPDPCSRFQPEGPHGPSQVVDGRAFEWTDFDWSGASLRGNVVYEMHLGTFTREGTWDAAEKRLPFLADLGINLLEIMPVADFSGDFGWGYDGVNMFAPTRLYGTPDDFRRFVNRAHGLRMGVILDVVYNHFGPDGNYHHAFSPDYTTKRHSTDWGDALNFDGENCGPVREFVTTNAAYWIDEFHLDGLRLDATQDIHDDSSPHILAEIAQAARRAAGDGHVFLVAENEPQDVTLVESIEQGGYGLDALWNDDLHHSATVALNGHSEAYYTDYRGTPQEFISAAKWGYLYQGQWYKWQKKRRGTPSLRLESPQLVMFLENHDQVANSGRGARVHQLSQPGAYRALTAYMLLMPATPMLFQGQEFASSKPFYYFASHRPDLAVTVEEGRREFLAQFPSLASPSMQIRIPDPSAAATFTASKLDWQEATEHVESVMLHRDLLRIRRQDPVISGQTNEIDGAVLSADAFVMRFFDDDGADRILLVNLGRDLDLCPAPEPLLAEPRGHRWNLAWSSEDPQYGGRGTPQIFDDDRCLLPGYSALLFAARKSPPS